jgi:large repetitive protein
MFMFTRSQTVFPAGIFAAALALAVIAVAQRPASQAIAVAEADHTDSPAPLGAATRDYLRNYREFAATKVGRDSEPEIFTLRFHQPATITAISASNDFYVSGGTCGENRSYASGESCTVEVTFTPQGPGRRIGQLKIAHDASGQPLTTPMGGEAYGPAVSFTPSLIETLPATLSSNSNGPIGVLANAQGLATDGGDNLYIADTGNNVIRFQDSSGHLRTLAGGGSDASPTYDGLPSGAKLKNPYGVAVDFLGDVFISDSGNNVVRAVGPNMGGFMVTDLGGGASGTTCPCEPSFPITAPHGIVVDPSGNLFVNVGAAPNYGNTHNILNQSEAWQRGDYIYLDSGSYGNLDAFTQNYPLAVDLNDDIYYADEVPAASQDTAAQCYIIGQNQNYGIGAKTGQEVWILAGTPECGYSGDGGLATGAEISTSVQGFAWDAAGNFYFTDTGNNRVRRIDALTGIIRTVAGNGKAGHGGDGGPATSAEVDTPTGIATDSDGNVYVIGTVISITVPQEDGLPKQDAPAESQSQARPDSTPPAVSYGAVREFGSVGSLEFASQKVGASSAAQTVLVSNVGNAALNLTRIAVTSGNSADFVIDPNTTSCNITLPLASGENCQIGVIFTPTDSGARSAVITLLDNTVDNGNTIEVSGTGIAPAAKPNVALASKLNPARAGETIEFEVKVEAASSPAPAGKVELKEGGSTLATAELASGVATFKISNFSAGLHTLTAFYTGDKTHAAAESNSVKQIVKATAANSGSVDLKG